MSWEQGAGSGSRIHPPPPSSPPLSPSLLPFLLASPLQDSQLLSILDGGHSDFSPAPLQDTSPSPPLSPSSHHPAESQTYDIIPSAERRSSSLSVLSPSPFSPLFPCSFPPSLLLHLLSSFPISFSPSLSPSSLPPPLSLPLPTLSLGLSSLWLAVWPLRSLSQAAKDVVMGERTVEGGGER